MRREKIEAQKAAGTYLTKAEKQRQAANQARLDALKAAGFEIGNKGAVVAEGGEKSRIVYNKKKPNKKSTQARDEVQSTSPEPAMDTKELEKAKEEESDEDDDDWEAAADKKLDTLAANLSEKVKVASELAIEDLEDVEAMRKAEELKQRGIEFARREEEARLKREEEEKDREEMEQKEREAAARKQASRNARMARDETARKVRSPDNLRSPISCIMGHVDTGKTKLLDKIRNTNVQEGEAGGITQQIGATQFSRETLLTQVQCMQEKDSFDIDIPGLLVIDTPGHESFSNLRSRGSSLCDIAILVIDLMHGLEQQTIESINMLKSKRTPFIVALNKVDRCYNWKKMPDSPIREALAEQDENTLAEFKDRSSKAILQLNELGLNAKLYWENDDLGGTVSLVPTSAHSGEGVPDILRMLITLSQTRLREQLMFMDVLQCTVLEVKIIEGLGHTIDVILVNGSLREGDTIIVSTMDGPVVTTIRALLTPPPNREMRVKNEYIHHQSLQGAIGIKIVASGDINRAVAGTPVLVCQEGDDLEDVKEDVQSDLTRVMKALETDQKGVIVHASTLGALEALLQFLREECQPPIPVSHINIGTIHKKDVMRANIQNERGQPEFATILAFDVKVDPEAAQMAEEDNVRIFTADIIYHLFDQFSAFMNKLTEERRQAATLVAVFPCVLKILPQHIFNKKDPIIMGVEVLEGSVRVGTPLVVPATGFTEVGRVIGIENNRKEVQFAKKGTSVSIKISNESEPNLMYGRQFDHTSPLYSKVTITHDFFLPSIKLSGSFCPSANSEF